MNSARLTVEPIPFAWAKHKIAVLHRHRRRIVGHRESFGVFDADGELRGVATVGRPVARGFDPKTVVEVTRVATDGVRNGCSALYGAACRWARAKGFAKIVTYTRADESGASLRAAGFREVARVRARAWSCASRPRKADELVEKIRWEIEFST